MSAREKEFREMLPSKGLLLDEVKQSLWKETSAKLITESLTQQAEAAVDIDEAAKELHPDYDITKSLKEIQEASSFYNFLRQRSQVKISDLASNYHFKKGSVSIGSRIHEIDSPTQLRAPSLASEIEGGSSAFRRPKPETSILGVKNRQTIRIEDVQRRTVRDREIMIQQDLSERFAMVQTSSRRMGLQTTSKISHQRTPSGQSIRMQKGPGIPNGDSDALTQMDIDLETPGLRRPRPIALQLKNHNNLPERTAEIPSPLKLEPITPFRKTSDASGEYYTPFMMRTQSQPLASSIQQFRATMFASGVERTSKLNPVVENFHDMGDTPVNHLPRKPSLDSGIRVDHQRKPESPGLSDGFKTSRVQKFSIHPTEQQCESEPTSQQHSTEKAPRLSAPNSPFKSNKVSVLKLISMFEKRIQPPKSSRKASGMPMIQPGKEFLVSSLTARNPFKPHMASIGRQHLASRIQLRQRSSDQSPNESVGFTADSAELRSARNPGLQFSTESKMSTHGDSKGRSFITKALETEMKFAETTGSLMQSIDGGFVLTSQSSVKGSLSGVLNRNHNPIVRGRILRNLERERSNYLRRSKM